MSTTKRFIPIQASLERILDTTSPNKIEIQDGKVLYTIDGGFSFFDLSGIRYLKASVAAVENLEAEKVIGLSSFKGGLSVVKGDSEGYQIFYTDSLGQVNHVAGGVSPDTKNTAGATNSDGKLFLVGSPTQDFTPQTYTNVNVFAENGELTANKLIAQQNIELGGVWEFDSPNNNELNFKKKNNTGRAILQITNSDKTIAYTDNITSAINTLNTTIGTQLNTKVDKTTKINGKSLTSDITLNTYDIMHGSYPLEIKLDDLDDYKADKATTLAGYGITNAYTKAEVDNRTSAVYRHKGNVATYANLPSTGLTVGDVYNVVDTGINYVWTGTTWDDIGGVEALATALEDGLMSKEDFVKLQNLDSVLETKADIDYVDTEITTINNSKVDNAPIDDKVYGQLNGDWTSLEDTAELRDALCFEGSWDPTSWTLRDLVDGGTI